MPLCLLVGQGSLLLMIAMGAIRLFPWFLDFIFMLSDDDVVHFRFLLLLHSVFFMLLVALL